MSAVDFDRDVVFTWNGTASGVRVPDGEWIPADRRGLTFADATSALFAQAVDWAKIDVATFSWQKILGGEAAHGMIVLSPRAFERLESYRPSWPVPKLFRLAENGRVLDGLFAGVTINTPSMLCVEDYLDALSWAESIGGLKALQARADANAAVLFDWIARTPWIANLAVDPATRSNTSVCLRFTECRAASPRSAASPIAWSACSPPRAWPTTSGPTGAAPPGLRIWCGTTIEKRDLQALTPMARLGLRQGAAAESA